MTVRTSALGGSDFIDGQNVSTSDMNDTWNKQVQSAVDMETNMSPPVGTIVAWHKTLASPYYSLPSSWLECNGQVVSDAGSPLNGTTLPNLNTTETFLRMASTSGNLVTTADHTHTVSGGNESWVTSAPFNASISVDGTSGSASANPPYIGMVWIIKVK